MITDRKSYDIRLKDIDRFRWMRELEKFVDTRDSFPWSFQEARSGFFSFLFSPFLFFSFSFSFLLTRSFACDRERASSVFVSFFLARFSFSPSRSANSCPIPGSCGRYRSYRDSFENISWHRAYFARVSTRLSLSRLTPIFASASRSRSQTEA